ncbi:hypothetical protein A2U01_0099107, partial [Trifolium medium]|nr:hypothetical protein [Trifolium medium]
KEEQTLPTPQGSLQPESTPTADPISEQDIVQEPPVKESGTQAENIQTGELKDQGVAQIQPNPETVQIEVEKDTTQH